MIPDLLVLMCIQQQGTGLIHKTQTACQCDCDIERTAGFVNQLTGGHGDGRRDFPLISKQIDYPEINSRRLADSMLGKTGCISNRRGNKHR